MSDRGTRVLASAALRISALTLVGLLVGSSTGLPAAQAIRAER